MSISATKNSNKLLEITIDDGGKGERRFRDRHEVVLDSSVKNFNYRRIERYNKKLKKII